jgi:hypothetical protein
MRTLLKLGLALFLCGSLGGALAVDAAGFGHDFYMVAGKHLPSTPAKISRDKRDTVAMLAPQ